MRRLGRSDLHVTELGFGAWQLGGHGWHDLDVADGARAVGTALECGVNLFDTADVYGLGDSERRLAAALGSRRHDVVVATKGGLVVDANGRTTRDTSAKHLSASIRASLERLDLDTLPLYQVHWPDGRTPLTETLDALESARGSGLIRWYGLSNFDAPDVVVAAGYPGFASLQLRHSLLDESYSKSLIAQAEAHGAGVITHSSLAQGLLAGRRRPHGGFPTDDNRNRSAYFQSPAYERNLRMASVVDAIARKAGVPAAQVAIRWVVDYPGVSSVLLGCRDAAQARSNFELHFRLDSTALRALAAAQAAAPLAENPQT